MSINPYQPPTVPDALKDANQQNHSHMAEPIGPAIYGAAVRLSGLYLILRGFYWGYYGLVNAAGVDGGQQYPTIQYAISAFFFVVVGVVVIRCADIVVALSYPMARTSQGTHDSDSE
jgi:hypothetical protein